MRHELTDYEWAAIKPFLPRLASATGAAAPWIGVSAAIKGLWLPIGWQPKLGVPALAIADTAFNDLNYETSCSAGSPDQWPQGAQSLRDHPGRERPGASRGSVSGAASQ